MLEQIKCNNDSVVVFTDQQMGLKWAVINRFNNSQLYQHNNGIRRKEKKKFFLLYSLKEHKWRPSEIITGNGKGYIPVLHG